MARAIYPHELADPDFAWLISNFRDNNPDYAMVEASCLPVSLVSGAPTEIAIIEESAAKNKEAQPPRSRKNAAANVTGTK